MSMQSHGYNWWDDADCAGVCVWLDLDSRDGASHLPEIWVYPWGDSRGVWITVRP